MSTNSANSDRVFYGQSGQIFGAFTTDAEITTLVRVAPGDDGTFAVQRPAIVELGNFANTANNSYEYSDGMNRRYGELKNLFLTSPASMAIMQTGRVINSKEYLCIQTVSANFINGSASLAILIPHTED
jgi:hypothetical protein